MKTNKVKKILEGCTSILESIDGKTTDKKVYEKVGSIKEEIFWVLNYIENGDDEGG